MAVVVGCSWFVVCGQSFVVGRVNRASELTRQFRLGAASVTVMQIEYTIQIWREGDQYVVHAMPLDVASAGATPEAARAAVHEAVKLFLDTARAHGTLAEVLEDAGYAQVGDEWQSPGWVGIERYSTTSAA